MQHSGARILQKDANEAYFNVENLDDMIQVSQAILINHLGGTLIKEIKFSEEENN